jgi:hypothetical protein
MMECPTTTVLGQPHCDSKSNPVLTKEDSIVQNAIFDEED